MGRPFRKEGAQHGGDGNIRVPQRIPPASHKKQSQRHMHGHMRAVGDVRRVSRADARVEQSANSHNLQIATSGHDHRQADDGGDEARLDGVPSGGYGGGVTGGELEAEEFEDDAVQQLEGVAIGGAGESKADDHAGAGFDVATRLSHGLYVHFAVPWREVRVLVAWDMISRSVIL